MDDQAGEGNLMTRSAALIVLAISVGLPPRAAWGGYDKTTWGMTIEQVQKLYPSGTVAKTPLECPVYRVSRRVDPAGMAYLIFYFCDGVLNAVDVKIPRPGSVADPKRNRYIVTTDAQAAKVWASLREYLGQKYGKPSGQGGSLSIEGRTVEPANVYWDGPGTVIRLARDTLEGNLTDVILNYTDATWMTYPTK